MTETQQPLETLHDYQMASQRALLATLERALTDLAELRAVLAPLLLSPYHPSWIDWEHHQSGTQCLFCGQYPDAILHETDCPVLRRDELLGRT